MNRLRVMIFTVSVVVLVFDSACFSDTFTHRKSREVLHGYAIGQVEGGKTILNTQERGVIKLNLAEWNIVADRLGRNNKVIILTIDSGIVLQIETEAIERAIAEASYEGPLFILLEVDTPGGRTDLAQRICNAIIETKNCQVIAFVKGGQHGGAISAGTAVGLACDRIYMANNTVIGAASVIAVDEDGPKAFKEAYGEEVGEKFSSAWRAYLASLAEQNGRSGLLARAMVDKDIEVVEVSESGKRAFIEPMNKKPQQRIVHTWSKKGSLLTLTAAEAVKSGMADGMVDSRQELIRDLGAADAGVVINKDMQDAAKEFRKVKLKFSKLRRSLDLKYKQAQDLHSVPRALRILREVRSDFKALIKLAKRYPDLHVNTDVLESELNSVEAAYQRMKIDSRRR